MLTLTFWIDNDQRWTLVPDDPVQIAAGLTANSQRTSGDDAEYEDAVNFMRRSTDNIGCEQEGTLGVTYSADSFDMDGFTPEPANYHSPRQTITVGVQWSQMKVDMCVSLLSQGLPLDLRSRVHVCNQQILPHTRWGVGIYADGCLEPHTNLCSTASGESF